MKLLFIIVIISVSLFNCTSPSGGTDVEVNSGSIFGQLLTDKKPVNDTVTVSLYSDDTGDGLSKVRGDKTPLRTQKCTNGTYEFDSLPAGDYNVVVTKDSIVIGGKDGIKLERKENKEVNITIVIIINQTFNIWTDESQNITINNFYIENGTVEKIDSGYILTSVETDTSVFEIEIEQDGDTSIVQVRIIREENGTASFEIVENDAKVIVSPGTDPADGFLGTITVDIKDPETVKLEASFDTTGVPMRNK